MNAIPSSIAHRFQGTLLAVLGGLLLPLALMSGWASAEVSEVRISRGYGAHFLPLYVMEAKGLFDREVAKAGLGPVKTTYLLVDGGNHINDAILAGAVDIASTGTGGFLTLWAKTHGISAAVIGLGGSAAGGMIMTSSNPAMHTLRDVTDKDRIAVPGIKTSLGAILLQMAVAKEFGDAQFARLDYLTVGMTYPDAVAALLSGKAGITAHVASPPFSYIELDQPNIHKVFSSVELIGRVTTIMTFTTERFRAANPRLTDAFVTALKEATAFVAANRSEAARIYLAAAHVKMSEAMLMRVLNDPDNAFTATPLGIMTYANFLHRVGLIKVAPASWKDVFVPGVHDLPGN